MDGQASRATRRQLYDRVHNLLQHLLRLIPTLPATLQPLLVQYFPHKRERTLAQVLYIQNLLRLSEYCEALTEPIWAAIVDHALQIDVGIQVELDELEEQGVEAPPATSLNGALDHGVESGSELSQSAPDAEEDELDAADRLEDLSDDDDAYDASDALSQAAPTPTEPAWNDIAVLAGKLDAIMKAMYDFLVQHVGHRNVPGVDTRRYQLYQTLLGLFTRSILTTFKSRHVQFLLFWFASLDAEFADMFLGTLLSKSLYIVPTGAAHDANDAVILRVAAASYVASYVARARYIDSSTTRMVVLNLCTYLDACLEAFAVQGAAAPSPGAREHAVFYAVAQAIFYVFCFRWRDLREGVAGDTPDDVAATYPTACSLELSPQLMPILHASSLSSASSSTSVRGERGWAPGLAVVQRAITSPLNPLRYCNANVVQQFAYVAQTTDFLYCYSVLEANAARESTHDSTRESTPTAVAGRAERPTLMAPATRPVAAAAATATGGAPAAQLDAFFPFDPYRLRDSSGLVHRLYREWSEVAPDGDGDEDEEDEEDDDADASDDDELAEAPSERRTKLSAMLRRHTALSSSNDPSLTPESVAQSLEAMSISPYTG